MERTDAVLVPKATVQQGLANVSTVSLVCTRSYVFAVPIQSFGGDGLTTIVRRYSYDGKSPLEIVRAIYDNPALTLSGLEEELKTLLADESAQRVFVLSAYPDFKLRAGWFGTGSFMFKAPGEGLMQQRAVAINDRDAVKRLKLLYPA
ncbi:MAG: hypothetical protein NTY77_18960 [Elusimicrobia bacterium]|nr:hypothetical protein [Elusimicrobiota bacterium]